MTDAERRTALEEIAAEVRVCTKCRLHQTRTKAVPGEGDPETEVIFVGEGPGFNEDRQGRPFIGRAGDLLVKLLASIGWRREDVFITNVVKCRPPDNRDPQPDEIAACAPYLRRQLEVLDPAVVVTLGRFSMGTFMPGARISQVHGTVRPVDPATGASSALVFAMYHPAAALRTPAIERDSYADIAAVPAALLDSRSRREAAVQAAVAQDAPVADSAARIHGDTPPAAAPADDPAHRHRDSRSRLAVRADPGNGRRHTTTDPLLNQSPRKPMHPTTNSNDQPLRIIPLGGVGEIGKNMYVFEYRDEIVVIDCGLMFPDEEMFGIDLVIPDITYLKERRANVKAFLITHAHEDHVGALPYVLPEFPGVPVYASTLARGLLGNKIKEHKLHNNPLIALEPGDEIDIGAFHVMPFRVGHSIPDAMGIALRTPVGTVVHTGDFKFDHTPGRRQAVRLRDPRPPRPGGRALPALGLDPCREPGLHAVGTDRRRGLPRDHGAARRPRHRGDLREQHRPRPAGPRRGRRHEPQRLGHRPLDGAELPDRDRPGLSQVRRLADRPQGQDQGPPGRQARHRHDRRPGRADGRPGPDGQPRPPLRRDPAR